MEPCNCLSPRWPAWLNPSTALCDRLPTHGGYRLPAQASRPGRPAPRSLLLSGHDLWRHESYVIHVGRAADIDHLGNIREIHIVVAFNEHDALGAVGINLSQLGQQIPLGIVGLVDLV